MRPRSRLILAALAAAPLSARAGEFASVPPVPGMALSFPEPGMASGIPVPPEAAAPPVPVAPQADPTGSRRPRAPANGRIATDGRLPNQRTGPKREHVVHDICIGC